jgi:hypothetical protein
VLAGELREADEVLPEEEELLVVHLGVEEALVEVGLAEELLEEAVEVAASPAAEALPEEVASAHEGEEEAATELLSNYGSIVCTKSICMAFRWYSYGASQGARNDTSAWVEF